MRDTSLSQGAKGRPRISAEKRAVCRNRWANEPDLRLEQLAADEGISYNSLRHILKGVEKAMPGAGS